jgi:hypothetical protein
MNAATLSGAQGQGVEFDRAIETPRRQRAVELLLSQGYCWTDGEWKPPARVVSDAQLSELVSATQELMWAWKQPGERSMHQLKHAMDFAYDRASKAVEALNVQAAKE